MVLFFFSLSLSLLVATLTRKEITDHRPSISSTLGLSPESCVASAEERYARLLQPLAELLFWFSLWVVCCIVGDAGLSVTPASCELSTYLLLALFLLAKPAVAFAHFGSLLGPIACGSGPPTITHVPSSAVCSHGLHVTYICCHVPPPPPPHTHIH